MDDRELLLSHVLLTLPPTCRLQLPRGAESLDCVDLHHADVKAILSQVRRAKSIGSTAKEADLIDLRDCPVRKKLQHGGYEDDVFVWGWRDYDTHVGAAQRRIFVRPPPPPLQQSSPRRDSAGSGPANNLPDVEPLDDDDDNVGGINESAAGLASSGAKGKHFAGPDFPEPIVIEAASVVSDDLFEPIESNPDLMNAVVYDNLLLIVRLFLDVQNRSKVIEEVMEMIRPSLGISNNHHTDAVRALCLPALSHVVDPSSKTSHLQKYPPASLPPESSLVAPTLQYIRLARSSNASSTEFIKRTNVVTKMECMRVPEGTAEYPLLFRAFLFTGVVGLLYHNDPTYSMDPEDLAHVLPLAKERLCLSDAVAACARVHSILIRYRTLPDPSGISREAVQLHFARSICEALKPMDLPGNDPQERTYSSYVLQRVLQFAVVPLVQCQSITNVEYFTLAAEVFTVASQVCTPDFFAGCLCRHFGEAIIMQETALSTDVLFHFVLSHMLCSPMFSEFVEAKDQITTSVPLPQMVSLIGSMFDLMLPVAAIWEKHVPDATALLVPGLVRMLSVAMWTHWKAAYRQPPQIPDDFANIAETTSSLLVGLLAAHLENATVMCNVHTSIEEFEWIGEFGKRKVEQSVEELLTLLEAMMMNTCWFDAKLDSGAHGSSFDIFAMFHQLLPPLNLLIVPTNSELFQLYIDHTLKLLREYGQRVAGPLDFSARAKQWEADYTHLSGFVRLHAFHGSKARRLESVFSQMSLPETVFRLNTLAQAFDNMKSYVDSLSTKHKAVWAIAGGPPLDIKSVVGATYRSLRSQCDDMCEILAIRVVHCDLGDLFSQLYRLDMAFYKKNKGNKKLLEEDPNGHLIFASPHITVQKVLTVVDNAMMVFLPFVLTIPLRERISSFVFFHFLLKYFDVILDGEERFFYPEQGTELFNDVCAVEEFFRSAISDTATPEMQGALSFLSAVKCVITLIMALPTNQLLDGSDTIVKYSDLPIQSPNSPFSKHIVWHILAHRKDPVAKKFVSSHANPNARK